MPHDESDPIRNAGDAIGPIPPLTDETRHRARLTIAGNARNVDDARLIMRALGLA